MSQQEQWRQIEGFEDYMVSDFGRVWSKKRNKLMSPIQKSSGYLQVELRKNGKYFNKTIHRLVAETFIPNPEGLPEVHHKNEDKFDNQVQNLEWVSSAYNSEFSKSKVYVLYDENDEPIEIYNIQKFARQNNLAPSNLLEVAHGKQNSYYGYTREPGTNLNRKEKIQLMSPEGEVFTFNNGKDAADYIGGTKGNISQLVKGKWKSYKGWTRAN